MKYANLHPSPVAAMPNQTTNHRQSRTMRLILRLARYPFAIALAVLYAVVAWLWSKA